MEKTSTIITYTFNNIFLGRGREVLQRSTSESRDVITVFGAAWYVMLLGGIAFLLLGTVLAVCPGTPKGDGLCYTHAQRIQ